MKGCFLFNNQLHGAVVGTEDVGVDGGGGDAGAEAFGGEEVVDAPAYVLLAGVEAVGPPAEGLLLRVEGAEGVDEVVGVQESGELSAFFVGETGVFVVGLGIFKVYLLVGYVHIATDDDGLLVVELHEEVAEGVFPLHAVVEAAQAVLGVGGVDTDEEEVGHLECDDASFVVVLLLADAVADAEWCVAGVDGSAGVAFLLGVVPVGLIAGEGEVELSGLHLGFLQAEKVGIEGGEDIGEAFGDAGS